MNKYMPPEKIVVLIARIIYVMIGILLYIDYISYSHTLKPDGVSLEVSKEISINYGKFVVLPSILIILILIFNKRYNAFIILFINIITIVIFDLNFDVFLIIPEMLCFIEFIFLIANIKPKKHEL